MLQKCPFYSGKVEAVVEKNPIEDIVVVQGDLLQRCPFYPKHMENAEESKRRKCPLRLPIDQDFMEQYPYIFDANATVETPLDHFKTGNRVEDEVDEPAAKGICPIHIIENKGCSSVYPTENLQTKNKRDSTIAWK